jgi:hypothetical protein
LKEHCPLTCGECCKDDPDFKFFKRPGREKNYEWVREKESRRTEWYKESHIKNTCVLSCTFYQSYGSSPSLTPSSEPSEPPTPASTLTLAPSLTPSSEPFETPITKPPTNASPQDPHGITIIYASQDSQNP